MSFFGNIGHFFKTIAKGVGQGFIKLFGADAAHAFANGAKILLTTSLGKLALDAVDAAATLTSASNAEKRTAAFSKLVADAALQGTSLPESMANLLIETAVSALKGRFTN